MLARRTLITGAGLTIVALMGAVLGPSGSARAEKPAIFTEIIKGVAVGGYDAVAYFKDGKPVEGKADIVLQHEGATWRFATAANRDAFKAEPTKYAPQYGGYCAYGAAKGAAVKGDPLLWRIVNGKLYLNFNQDVQTKWNADIPGFIAQADANWPKPLAK
jgi:YHS domain-containing protein